MTDKQDTSADDPKPTRKIREIDSEELFLGERMLLIEHAGEIYRLQITRNNKLILQK